MKKLFTILCLLFFICFAVSCKEQDLPVNETVDMNDNDSTSKETIDIDDNTSKETEDESSNQDKDIPYMFMLDGKLYVDTGEVETSLKCGVMDYNFKKVIHTDQIPSSDGEANFKSESNGVQIGRRENRMTAFVDGVWRIFAYNENNLDGVSMTVKDATDSKLTVIFDNQLRKEFIFGEWMEIEQYDEKNCEWISLDEICEYAAFNEIGFILQAAGETEQEVKFDWLYGKLKPGKYRIIKEVIDSGEPGDLDKYWLLAEFTVE